MLSTGLVRRAATTTSRLLQQHNFHTSVTIRAEDDKWQRNALGNSSQKYNENFNRIFQVDNMNRPLKSEEGAQKEQVTLPAMTTEEAEARAALAAAKAARQFGTAVAAKKEDLDTPARRQARLLKEKSALMGEIDVKRQRLAEVDGLLAEIDKELQ